MNPYRTPSDQLRAAQSAYDNASPGYGEPWDERAEELESEYAADPEKVAEADEWMAGTLDYDGIDTDLADLHEVPPSSLLGSAVLERLYRRAAAAHAERMKHIERMAESDAFAEWEQSERDRGDAECLRRELDDAA